MARDAQCDARLQLAGATRLHAGSTGNAAFDEWKAAEIARLEEERRKLQEASREFSEFVENIRRAKDREEFERFMNERRNRPADGSAGDRRRFNA